VTLGTTHNFDKKFLPPSFGTDKNHDENTRNRNRHISHAEFVLHAGRAGTTPGLYGTDVLSITVSKTLGHLVRIISTVWFGFAQGRRGWRVARMGQFSRETRGGARC
jgi:hypothetical protein